MDITAHLNHRMHSPVDSSTRITHGHSYRIHQKRHVIGNGAQRSKPAGAARGFQVDQGFAGVALLRH